MKKRLSSILALVLVFAMLASFAGCSKEVDPKEEIIKGTKATFAALKELRDARMVAQQRGVSLDKVFNG